MNPKINLVTIKISFINTLMIKHMTIQNNTLFVDASCLSYI